MSSESHRPGGSASTSAAPGDLELVRAFVNTLDIEAGRDDLESPRGALAWLRAHGQRLARAPSAAELRRLSALREAIRDAVTGRGTRTEAAAFAALDRLATAHPLTIRLSAASPFAQPAPGVGGFVERVLGLLAVARIDGTWARLKACPNDRCRWLFYDHSRNGSRTWCSMDVCGARSKMRSYRARRSRGMRASRSG